MPPPPQRRADPAELQVFRPAIPAATLRACAQFPACDRAELLDEWNCGHLGLMALGEQIPDPLQVHRPGSRAAFPADDQPVRRGRARVMRRVPALVVQAHVDRAEQRLSRHEPHGGQRLQEGRDADVPPLLVLS